MVAFTFIFFLVNVRVKTHQRLNDRVLDDVAYDIDSEAILPLFMDEVDIFQRTITGRCKARYSAAAAL